jgi:hypothetical protein
VCFFIGTISDSPNGGGGYHQNSIMAADIQAGKFMAIKFVAFCV